MSSPQPPASLPADVHPAAVKITAQAARTAAAGYPCPYCPGTAAYRYDMTPGARWFRCTGCGIEMPEGALTAHTPR